MNRKSILTITFLLVSAGTTHAQTVKFIREFGTPRGDGANGLAVGGGKVYVVGDTCGNLARPSFGKCENFLREYTTQGVANWTRQFDPLASQDVAVSNGSIFLAGTFGEEGGYIRKFNSTGTELWARPLGKRVVPMEIKASAGILYLAGMFCPGGYHGYCTSYGAWVGKFDFPRNQTWTRPFGTEIFTKAEGVAVSSEDVYVVGDTFGTLPDQPTNAGEFDAFVRKYDKKGNIIWTRQFGTAGYDQAYGVAANSSGIYVVGHTTGEFPGKTNAGGGDTFVRKYNSEGTALWTDQFGSPEYDHATAVAVNAGGVYVLGTTNGALPGQTGTGNEDIFVRKYSFDGAVLWTRQIGVPTGFGVEAQDIEVDGANGVYVAGFTEGAFPGQVNRGVYDAFLMKLQGNAQPGETDFFGPE